MNCLLGKIGSTAVFGLMYTYTVEVFPTEIRGTALGLCSMMSRIGGFGAAQVYMYWRRELLSSIICHIFACIRNMILNLHIIEIIGCNIAE